ncbi:MAG: ABC-F family ATP-binding cassette domain-containing protein, partial [Bacillota bacterium]|nr:ABC-F family ATP-binding cassette domain-containing protein [Bacillota bacterium]
AMPDIQISSLTKFFGEKQVLCGASLEIAEGEKVGLVGANGAGKTTLFRILTGDCVCDSGSVFTSKDKTVAVLDQIPVYPEDYTANDVMKTAFLPLIRIKEELNALEKQMAASPEKNDVKRYGELLLRYEALGGYNMSFTLDRVANGLRIPTELRSRPFFLLSGGEKTRINLARVILTGADILLLDEPTNHLDLKSCDFLGSYLESVKKTIVAISHDRYFLDQIADRILELEDGKITSYIGNYSSYAVEKERRREEALRLYERNEQEKKRLLDSARKLHAWGTQSVKMHQRAFSIEKRVSRMKAFERPKTSRSLSMTFSDDEYYVEDVVTVKGLSKSYDGRNLFGNISFTVKNGDRIAIVGDNGAGKTTLLRLLLSEEKADTGLVRMDSGLRPGYLPQNVSFSHPSRNLIDTLIYEKSLSTQESRNRLGAFGFSGEEQLKTVSLLSGGEKSRLMLCMLMCDKINMLILDEPTNHLDIPSREWIEDAVSAFPGTIVFVSHDRYFLSRFANRIFELRNGSFTDFKGTYEDFEQTDKLPEKEPEPTAVRIKPAAVPFEKDKKALKRKITVLENDIDRQEKRLSEIENDMQENAADHIALERLLDEKSAVDSALSEMMEQWQALSEKL